jgi:hypothetical protein
MLDARRHADAELRFRATPALRLGLGARYDRTETPGEISLDTGILGDRRRAERWEAVPSFAYRFTPRSLMTASYAWTTEALVEGMSGTLHVARAGYTRQTSTRDEITLTGLGRLFIDDTGPLLTTTPAIVSQNVVDSEALFGEATLPAPLESAPVESPFVGRTTHRSAAALFGWTHELAYQTRLTLQGGPRVSTYRTGALPEVAATLTRKTNRIHLTLDYWHGETIILGIRGPVAVDSGTARASWPIKRTVEIGAHAGVSDATTLDGENARVYRGFLVGSWNPAETYIVAVSYGIDIQNGIIRRSLLSDENVLRHTVRVTLTVAPRLSRAFQRPGEPPTMRPKGVQE